MTQAEIEADMEAENEASIAEGDCEAMGEEGAAGSEDEDGEDEEEDGEEEEDESSDDMGIESS